MTAGLVTATVHPGLRPPWLIRTGLLPATRAQRIIAASSFINMLGSGVFLVSASLYFTRVAGLSIAQVGLALGVAAAVGLAAGIPVGHLADRRGSRGVYLATLCVQGAAMGALVVTRSFWLVMVALTVGELARSASTAARAPLVRGYGGGDLPRFRAYLRSVANLAASVGAIAAGVAVQAGTTGAYTALVVGNAVSFVACAAVVARLAPLPPVAGAVRPGRWLAVRDRGFMAVTVLDGVLSMQGRVLFFALPLWIVDETRAPRWLVGAVALINTVLVVVAQVRFSRGVDSGARAGRAMRRAGVAYLVAMVAVAVTAGAAPWVALAVIVAAVCVHTVGELWHAAGSLELRFRLAPAHAQGQYAGAYGLGSGVVGVVAPSAVGLLCVTWGAAGWIVLGLVFAAAGAVMPAVVRFAGCRQEAAV